MKRTALSILIILSLVLTTSCSSDPDYGLQVTMVAPYVDVNMLEDYGQTLMVGEQAVSVLGESIVPLSEEEENTGEESVEESLEELNNNSMEMMGTAGMMKVTARIASKEVDVILSDYENGQRFAASGSFMPLEELFTEQELAELDESLFVSYEEMDDEGDLTGVALPASGIDVSGVEELTQFMVTDTIICHVVSNSENVDVAKEYMLSLIG